MYKVFFNDSSILISSDIKKSSKNNIVNVVKHESYEFVDQIVRDVESGKKATCFVIIHQEVNQAWGQFRSRFVEIPAAGGLVRNDQGMFLFIKRFGVWDLPKGKIEKKETPEIAAVREVEEECSISGPKIIMPLNSTFHIYRSLYHKAPKNLVLKETKWYLMDYSGNETPVPQIDEEIEQVKWFTASELDWVMNHTYASISELILNSMPFI
jgi:8-oxo-dGTP pyrophosphatase MutT (NUDIX family)